MIIIRSMMKNYRNFFRYTIFQITYAMRSTSLLSFEMTMISNFTVFFIFKIFIFKFFFTNITDLCIFIWFLCSFVNNFIFFFLKLVIFIACSLKYSQNFFIQYLPLYTSCLFPMLLNEDIVDIFFFYQYSQDSRGREGTIFYSIVDIEKPDGICSLTFAVN